MLFRNSVRLFLRAEKQMLSAVTIPARNVNTSRTFNASGIRSFPVIEPVANDIEEILSGPNPSDEQWSRVYNYFANQRLQKTPSPYLEIVRNIKCMDEQGYLLKAFNLYEHIRNNNHEVNIAEKLVYARVCYENRGIINERHKKNLECFCDEIMTKSAYMDEKSLMNCLEVLSLTDRWKEIEDIIQERNDIKGLRGRLLSCLAIASFRNNRFDKGWSFIRESYETNYIIQQYVYIDYVEICSRNKQTFKANMKAMFQLWGEYAITPSKDVIAEYVRAFRRLGLNAWYTKIFKHGQCERCDTFLRRAHVTPADQQALADYALKHLIIGSDLYIKSHPKELDNLRKFVEAAKPYDVVVDGLNLYYKCFKKADQKRRSMIAQCFEGIKKDAKGVVVILRKHLQHANGLMKLLKGTKIFYADDLSKDDPFLLYVTWSSEPNAKFISGDIVRDHLAVLPDLKSRNLFTKWMLCHRCYFRAAGTLSTPLIYDPVAHGNEDTWHVPYRHTAAPTQFCVISLEEIPGWVCFQFK